MWSTRPVFLNPGEPAISPCDQPLDLALTRAGADFKAEFLYREQRHGALQVVCWVVELPGV